MKSRNLTLITAMTLFAALATPVRITATDHKKQQPRYIFVDLGTLGGPSSTTVLFAQVLNKRGTFVGSADTSTPNPNYPNFNPYIGVGGPDPFLQHAFEWQRGTLMDLGALPGVNNSNIQWENQQGAVVGLSENGTIDPITGWPAAVAVLWKDGQITNLGTLGGNESLAYAINDRGQIVGVAANAIPDPFCINCPGYGTQERAFLWEME